jgi:hypothetical protein
MHGRFVQSSGIRRRCGKPAAVGGDPVGRLPQPEQCFLVSVADEAGLADLLGGYRRKAGIEPNRLLRLPDPAVGLTRIGILQARIAEGLDIPWAERHGTIQMEAGTGEVAPHLEQHAEQPVTLWIQWVEGDRLLRMADRSFPSAILFAWRDPASGDVAHGEPAMGDRRGRILLESTAEVLEGTGM